MTVLIPVGQSAALGVGRVVAKPRVRGKQIGIRSMVGLSLTYDHQVLAGATGTEFRQMFFCRKMRSLEEF